LALSGWDDVIGVDFTRTAQSVQRTGADLQKWAKEQVTSSDIFSGGGADLLVLYFSLIYLNNISANKLKKNERFATC
jgi:hypothetical protein